VGLKLHLKKAGRCLSWDERHSNCYIRYSSGMAGAGMNDMVLASRNSNGYDADGLLTGAITVILWQTFSRGEMRVTNPDPFAMPQIDQKLLSDERDLVRMREGARRLFDMARSRAIQSISEEIELARDVTGSAGRTMEDVSDDRALDEWMLQSVRDTWHLVGTCRMGAPDDPRSVVDPDCRVLGVEGLRVIDGSIMPEVPRANTNLTCMTIAEHMAARLEGRSL
jgi:5-(hydroxymethyl)furfural/furfural oxidase